MDDVEDIIAQQDAEATGRFAAKPDAEGYAMRQESDGSPQTAFRIRMNPPHEAAKKNGKPPSTLSEAALWYARRGWPVIPLQPSRKTPDGTLVPHGSKDATTDEKTVIRWWEECPTANIGIVGASAKNNFFVIDVDCHDDCNGFKSIEEAGVALPETLIAETPSGGRHYFYKWTQGGKPKQTQSNIHDDDGNKILGVDVRGVNGYVVVSPSLTNDGTYRWFNDRFDDLAEFPEWAKHVGARRKENDCKQARTGRDECETRLKSSYRGEKTTSAGTGCDAEKRAVAYLCKVDAAVQGRGGHNALLHAAEVLAVGFGLDDATVMRLLWDCYNPRCIPPWGRSDATVREFQHKIDDARRTSMHAVGYLLNNDVPSGGGTDANKAKTDSPQNLPPFTNACMLPTIKGGKRIETPVPKRLNELSMEVLRDYDGWPRNIGGELFDYHQNENPDKRIEKLRTPAEFFAWIARRGDRTIEWHKSLGCHSKDELFAQMRVVSRRYEAICSAPHFPMRDDCFYSFPPLPPCDPTHKYFEEFVAFFNPCDDAHKTLMKAFFLAPL